MEESVIKKVRNHRNYETLSEELYRKMQVLWIRIKRKFRKYNWSDIEKNLNSWSKVKKSGNTHFHIWSMGTIVMPLIIVRLCFRHGEPEIIFPVGKSIWEWSYIIFTLMTLYRVHFSRKLLQLWLKNHRVQIITINKVKKEGSCMMIKILSFTSFFFFLSFTSKQDFWKTHLVVSVVINNFAYFKQNACIPRRPNISKRK